MNKLLFLIFILIHLGTNGAEINFNQYKVLPEKLVNRIADAIFKIEGGDKTKYPYGIKSIKTNNPRQICINTINNNFVRWINSGRTNDFISYLGGRFCPLSDKNDTKGLNKNWIKNLKSELNK